MKELPRFLREPFSPQQAAERIRSGLEHRSKNFLYMLQCGIFNNGNNVYRQLLDHANITFNDVSRWVESEGLESTLLKMYQSGVYVTMDEFKGRRPIERPGLKIETRPRDFDNPLRTAHIATQTSGSTGRPQRVALDLDLIRYEADYWRHYLDEFEWQHRPYAIYRPVPPSATGLKVLLRLVRLGKTVDRWFSQKPWSFRALDLRFYLAVRYTLAAGRFTDCLMPTPEFVSLEDAARVAAWLEQKKTQGSPAVLDTNCSSGIRVCQAARELNLDISGTDFRFGGEPYTASKARVVEDAGCKAVCQYSISEIGNVGVPCGAPEDLDEVHLLADKQALIKRPLNTQTHATSNSDLVFTTLLPSTPKLMLNVESDDYANIQQRHCGCIFEQIGLTTHLSTIRSHGKLTSEGVTFLGTELLTLVEEVLPGKFGGHSSDYQFCEWEEDGITQVSLLVSPAVELTNEREAISTVYEFLRQVPGGEVMVASWQQAATLSVVRRSPYVTSSAKTLPLHRIK